MVKIKKHNRKSGYNNQSKMCYRCLKGPHNPNDCWYKNYRCDKCQKTGHLTKAHKDSWHKNSSSGQNNVYHTKQDNTSKNTNKKVHHVENYDDSDETSSDEISFFKVIKTGSSDDQNVQKGEPCKISNKIKSKKHDSKVVSKRYGSKVVKYIKYCKSKDVSKPYFKPVHNKPYFMSINCENTNFKFEMDSGSGITLMPYEMYKKKLNHVPLNSTKLKAVTLKGTMNVIGQIQVNAEYKANIFLSTYTYMMMKQII